MNYIDVSIVVGADVVELYSNDDSKLYNYFRNLINYSNLMLGQLNLKISSTNLIKWDNGNYINVTLNSEETLARFKKFCILNRSYMFKSDHYTLFSMTPFYGNIIGKAYVGTMCTPDSSMSMIVYRDDYEATAITFVHELGHSLGMSHDSPYISTEDCSDTAKCIMHSFYIKSSQVKLYSKYSTITYEKNKPYFLCINDKPKCISGIWSMKRINMENNLNLNIFEEGEYTKKIRIQSRLDENNTRLNENEIKLKEYKTNLKESYFSQKHLVRQHEKEKIYQNISYEQEFITNLTKNRAAINENYNETIIIYKEHVNKVKTYRAELEKNNLRYNEEDEMFLKDVDKIYKIPDLAINDTKQNTTPVTTLANPKTNNKNEEIIKTILKVNVESKVKRWKLNPFLTEEEMTRFITIVFIALVSSILLVFVSILLCCRKRSYDKIRQ